MIDWLIYVMMICFSTSMIILLVDSIYVKIKRLRLLIAVTISLIALFSSLALLLLNWSLAPKQYYTIRPLESIFSTLYVFDNIGFVIVFMILLISISVVFYSKFYIGSSDNVGPYFSLIILMVVSMIGVVVAGDLLALFLFWEAMSICAYGLASFNKEDQLSLESTIKYLLLAGTGSLMALLGIGLIYNETKSILISDLGKLFSHNIGIGQLGLLFLLIGLGVEAAIFPLHTWLPDVYSSSHPPVTSLFVGATKATSFYALIKILQQIRLPEFSITQLNLVIGVIAILTMIVGNFSAVYQSNIRRLLAYSSITHAGYILASLSTISSLGFLACIFHIWNYCIVKSALFLLTGTISRNYEDSDLNRFIGIGGKDKLLGSLFAALSLAMVGSPPFGLFWSELLIIKSLLISGTFMSLILAISIVINILISIGYYYKIINTITLGAGNLSNKIYDRMMLVPILILTFLSLATGIMPWMVINWIT
ncbi:MAG: proton-conducting transporter membrane subunit [Nitrososphaerota archaeon]